MTEPTNEQIERAAKDAGWNCDAETVHFWAGDHHADARMRETARSILAHAAALQEIARLREALESAVLFVGHASTTDLIIVGFRAVDLESKIYKLLGRCAWCGNPDVRECLDGDNLCQKCCDEWAKGEGIQALGGQQP